MHCSNGRGRHSHTDSSGGIYLCVVLLCVHWYFLNNCPSVVVVIIVVVDDDVVLTDLVVCLILKISMNVTLVTTPVQQNKYVSISREATHAWILYSAPLPTSKLVTSECSTHPLHLHPPSCTHCSSPPLSVSPLLQSVHVFSREPCLQGQTLHYSVPTHGSVVGPQRARRYLPDAGHHALPRRLLHLPDKVGKRRARVLHEGERMQRHGALRVVCVEGARGKLRCNLCSILWRNTTAVGV